MSDTETAHGTREETDFEDARDELAELMASDDIGSFVFAGVSDTDPDCVEMTQYAAKRDGCDVAREMLLAAMLANEANARGISPLMYLYRLTGVVYLLDDAAADGDTLEADIVNELFGWP